MTNMTEREKQEYYRNARVKGDYDRIWQEVGKCVFCDMNPKYTIFEQDGVVLTVPLYAYIDGHLMIVPRRHVRSNKELTTEEWEAVRKFMYIAKKLIREVHGIKSVQYLQKEGQFSQSTVEHLHWHVIPFDSPNLSHWNHRKLKYTPVENAGLYKALSRKLQKLEERFGKKYGDS